ncbi:N-carbamoyl-D-amino-acid hydrolase [Siculibacillus lacustris]|uniref:N-carbamoyl-D-amino-acid hydrolase n=1 Tax=Siculibacillus lacustris TaxID=1549641 RepID=A0A4Q9VRP3_9HYPH|nr:N-carbamoyl-D-amino-acid hydrolase [Siculibacillus lacustris]TBW38442.1 N-carbamoyl-D-amino-acid hydrolase [Siculibacillus lacustris]
MPRNLVVGAAQLGPIARAEPREAVVVRMIALLDKAAARGCGLVVFPELALTTFFPRWYMPDQAEVDTFFETEMPNAATLPLFERARALGIGFSFGFAEKLEIGGRIRRFNTAILVDGEGQIVHRYRKIHLPGHTENEPWRAFQHLEKRYFEPGEEVFSPVTALGGEIGLAICNDRRWPETYREHALRGTEMVLIGYNTPVHYPLAPEHDHLQCFHNHLSLQAGAYQNGLWVVGVAKAGKEENCDLIGQSCIVAPTGEIVAQASTLHDELVIHDCDFDRCTEIRANIFDFAKHRRPEMYPLLSAPIATRR